MTSATDDLPLAAEFQPATYGDWRKLVDGVLKGAPFEKLVSKTYDGLRIEPIYSRGQDTAAIEGRALTSPWQIMQRIDHPDAATANAQALHELENGASGLEIEFAGGPGARGFGLIDARKETLVRVFDGVIFDAGIAIALNPVLGQQNAGLNLADVIEASGVSPGSVDVRFNYQPLSTMAVRGATAGRWAEMERHFAKAIGDLMDRGFKGPFALADGRPIHDAGGSEAQELAFALSVAVAYLRALEAGGMALDKANAAISFRLSADADQFLTMAKFRAMRLLWTRVEQSCGLAPKPIFIAAETAWRMLTQRDAYVNMLRATVATFSAGLGGANAITVLPHTLALGLPDALARRAARNTQLVLLEESNLAKVSDPAAGSGGIETLTKQLCEAAWSLFQDIEKTGGVFAALEQGLIQRKVAETRTARDADIAKRRRVLTGATEFPNLHEAQISVLQAAVSEVASLDAPPVLPSPSADTKITFDPLPAMRLAVPFEQLRDRSDQILKERGARPRVFLANLGTAADFTPRATFAKSFFETGGIEAIDTEGSTDPAALATAFRASGADLVCLCSSDKIYADQAVMFATALQAGGVKHIYLAGRPGELEAPLRAAGVSDFIAAGGNALATLNAVYAKLSVSEKAK